MDDGGLNDGCVVVGVVGDIGGEAEEGFEEGDGRDGDQRMAVVVQRGDEIAERWIAVAFFSGVLWFPSPLL